MTRAFKSQSSKLGDYALTKHSLTLKFAADLEPIQ